MPLYRIVCCKEDGREAATLQNDVAAPSHYEAIEEARLRGVSTTERTEARRIVLVEPDKNQNDREAG